MTIASTMQRCCSIRAMARMLGRSVSTISRELGRNASTTQAYASHVAQVHCALRRRHARPAPKLDLGGVTWAAVLTLLDWKWSPQQIAGTLKRVFPDEPERHVSHETIYTAIYAQPRCCVAHYPGADFAVGFGKRSHDFPGLRPTPDLDEKGIWSPA